MAGRFPRVVLLALAALVPWVPAAARVSGEIVEFGEMSVRSGGSRPPNAEERTLGDIRMMMDEVYVTHSDRVEAALCRTFGVTVRLDAPRGEGVPRTMQVRVTHPRVTRPDGLASTEDVLVSSVMGGVAHQAFTFDEPWEMQPGVWEFAFYADGALVASQAFTVTVPAGRVPSICEGPVS